MSKSILTDMKAGLIRQQERLSKEWAEVSLLIANCEGRLDNLNGRGLELKQAHTDITQLIASLPATTKEPEAVAKAVVCDTGKVKKTSEKVNTAKG
jgi:hypothetical protein